MRGSEYTLLADVCAIRHSWWLVETVW